MLVGAAALLLACLLLVQWRLQAMAYDDAYIHLRLVRNLLGTGHAWFNPGERVMVTSSPLWTVLLAMLHLSRLPTALPVLEALLLWLAVVAAAVLAMAGPQLSSQGHSSQEPSSQDAAARGARVIAAGTAVLVLLAASAIGQMETPLAIALLLLAWAAAQRNSGAALPLFACAAMTRLEWLPLLPVVALLWLIWTRRWWPVAFAAAVVVLAAGWTWRQFGVLLPNSMRAKQIAYGFTLSESVHEFVASRLQDEALCLLLLLGLLVCATDAWRAWRDGRLTPLQALPLLSQVGSLVLVAEYILRHTLMFSWYRPLVLVPMALGLLLYRPAVGRPRHVAAVLLAVRLCAFGLLVAPAMKPALTLAEVAAAPTVRAESRIDAGDAARVETYLQVGKALRETCPQGRLMTPEIGALSWAFNGYIYDGFGIASPGALRYQPLQDAPRGGLPAGFVEEVRPDVIVSYQVLDMQLRKTPALQSQYRLLMLPPSVKAARRGSLDRGWKSSIYLDIWLRHDGLCDTPAVLRALENKF